MSLRINRHRPMNALSLYTGSLKKWCMPIERLSVSSNNVGNASMIEKMPPKGVTLSDFICIFAISYNVVIPFELDH